MAKEARAQTWLTESVQQALELDHLQYKAHLLSGGNFEGDFTFSFNDERARVLTMNVDNGFLNVGSHVFNP